jgi:hypothetical protein
MPRSYICRLCVLYGCRVSGFPVPNDSSLLPFCRRCSSHRTMDVSLNDGGYGSLDNRRPGTPVWQILHGVVTAVLVFLSAPVLLQPAPTNAEVGRFPFVRLVDTVRLRTGYHVAMEFFIMHWPCGLRHLGHTKGCLCRIRQRIHQGQYACWS